ncbi:TolC family protein, partial [Aquifex sp.]
ATVLILEKQIKRLEEHYKNVKALYEEGYVALKDILETKVKLYEVKNQLSQVKVNYQKSLDLLSFLTGKNIKDVEEIEDFALPKNIDVSQNPKLIALSKAVHLSRVYTDLVASSFYPILDLTLLYQRTNESPSLPKDRYFIGLNLKWNIFSGGKRVFELRKARANLQIANLEYLKEKEFLKVKLKGVLRDIKVLKEEIITAKVRLSEAREHYRLALEKYKNGLGTNAEVLDAEAYLTSAEQELKIKKYELLLTKFKLLEVIGR